MIEQIIAISNEPYYQDDSTIHEICSIIEKIPMRRLLKKSGYLNYDLSWYAKCFSIPISKIHRMNFFEFAYHLFDPRMDTNWKEYSEWENKIFCVQVLYMLMQIFVNNDLDFMRFAQIDLASYLSYRESGDTLMNDLADRIAESNIPIRFDEQTGGIGIFDFMSIVNKNFYNCARMYTAKEAYEMFAYIWKYPYEFSHHMKKGA